MAARDSQGCNRIHQAKNLLLSLGQSRNRRPQVVRQLLATVFSARHDIQQLVGFIKFFGGSLPAKMITPAIQQDIEQPGLKRLHFAQLRYFT